MRHRFKKVVQKADLPSPLQKDVLKDARGAFQTGAPRKLASLARKVTSPLKKEKILSISAKDVGKFS